MPHQKTLPLTIERRRFPRYRLGNGLLCVSDYYAGQIMDISPTGMAFHLVNFTMPPAKATLLHLPLQSGNVSILHAGPLSYFIMKNLRVKETHDLATGLLYPGNANIMTFRRGVSFAEPLADGEFDTLHPYLAES